MSRARISTTISSCLACLLLLTLAKAEPHDQRSKSEDDALVDAGKPALVWVCEEWVELWQGSGRARNCEWRPAVRAEPLR